MLEWPSHCKDRERKNISIFCNFSEEVINGLLIHTGRNCNNYSFQIQWYFLVLHF